MIRASISKSRQLSQDFSDSASTSSCSESDGLSRFKTELCRNWMKGYCAFDDTCCFAHGVEELRNRQVEEKPCQHYFQHGYCLYGIKCQFSHERLNFERKLSKVRVIVPHFIEFV